MITDQTAAQALIDQTGQDWWAKGRERLELLFRQSYPQMVLPPIEHILATPINAAWYAIADYALAPATPDAETAAIRDHLACITWILFYTGSGIAPHARDHIHHMPPIQWFVENTVGELWARAYIRAWADQLCAVKSAAGILNTTVANVIGYMNRGDLYYIPNFMDAKRRRLLIRHQVEQLALVR